MKRNIILFALLPFVLLSGCFAPKRTNNTPDQSAPVINEVCKYQIDHFNSNASYSIINDLKTIHEYRKMLPTELKALYPEARDAWNSALRSIENNFSGYEIETGLASFNGSFENWRETEMEDYQKFFFYLTEYRHGPYPSGTKETMKQMGWQENADIRMRMDAMIKRMNDDCRNVSSDKIRPLLKGQRLPETVEECLSR